MTREERQRWYLDYLQSPWWKSRRERSLFLAQWQCQSPICEDKHQYDITEPVIRDSDNAPRNLQVHHLTYERLGQELDDDLIVLCKDCHAQIHGLVPIEDSPDLWRAYRSWLESRQRKTA